MLQSPVPICAAIDVGSNTIHLVVARCYPHTLEILADETDVTRIGTSVTATGAISQEKTQAALKVLDEYKMLAEQLGSEKILVVATEAIRQASNSADFIKQVLDHTGLKMHLISGPVEASLTFWGATYAANQPHHLVVADLGGGSLELVFATNMQVTWSTSLRLGSGWLHDHYLLGDPPLADEIAAAEHFLDGFFRDQDLDITTLTGPTLIVTGGSANSLAYLAFKAFNIPEKPPSLTMADLQRCRQLLSTSHVDDLAARYDQRLARVQVMLAGTLILQKLMQVLDVDTMLVSSHGIREGALLAYTRYGEDWLSAAAQLQPTKPDI